MNGQNTKDPLHGVTLDMLVTQLVKAYGWQGLAEQIDLNCFHNNPSVKASLKFLRRTPWARKKVEELYLHRIMIEREETPSS